MYSAEWEFLPGEEFLAEYEYFDTLQKCIEWLGDKLNNPDYFCQVVNRKTGRIALLGWMP